MNPNTLTLLTAIFQAIKNHAGDFFILVTRNSYVIGDSAHPFDSLRGVNN
jgi:hypothetical protein